MCHLGYELLQFHMVNASVYGYQGQTIPTDVDIEIAEVDLYDLIIGFHFEPEGAGH